MPSARIGVFDSGLGGLTVVRELLHQAPGADILYVADQAHVPYGPRPLEHIRAFAEAISRYLQTQGCATVVMACNISSATALETVRCALPDIQCHGVIDPAVRSARQGPPGPVGVLATAGTIASRAYSRALGRTMPAVPVTEVACPDFVPIVEGGRTGTAEALDACSRYLAPLRGRAAQVILGCKHYPLLLPDLHAAASAMGWMMRVVDPAAEAAREAILCAGVNGTTGGRLVLQTTGDGAHFSAQAQAVLGYAVAPAVMELHWHEDGCLA